MQKIQVLLPEPTMRRLREVARIEDRPMSELIRRATERWLERLPDQPPKPGERVELPAFDLGVRVTDPRRLKEAIYDRDAGG
jgi:hypothetical protein